MTPPTIRHVSIDGDRLVFRLDDDRDVSLPVTFSRRLAAATPAERAQWTIGPHRLAVHWPDLDEDIAIWDVLGITEEAYLRSLRASPVG